MDFRQKRDNTLKDNDIVKMIFSEYNEKTGKLEPFGSMLWSGSYWDIDADTPVGTIKNFYSTGVLENTILTQKDYDLCVTHTNIQSRQVVVKGITKKFYEENFDKFKNNPLLIDSE